MRTEFTIDSLNIDPVSDAAGEAFLFCVDEESVTLWSTSLLTRRWAQSPLHHGAMALVNSASNTLKMVFIPEMPGICRY